MEKHVVHSFENPRIVQSELEGIASATYHQKLEAERQQRVREAREAYKNAHQPKE